MQDARKPPDDGRMHLPPVSTGMNRLGPGLTAPADTDRIKDITLGRTSTEEDEDAKLLDRMRKRWKMSDTEETPNRIAGLEDKKFEAGDQWPQSVIDRRMEDNRPCFTMNSMPTFVKQVTNEQRQNRPQINVSPIGDRSDRDVAKMLRGMIRYIERDSHAELAYDTSFDGAASIGWGYFRDVTEYESPTSMNQTIVVKRIRNPFSVHMDPYCQEPDCADAKWGFVTEMVPKDEFKETYPDANVMSWDEASIGDTYKDWVNDKLIRVAEYFEITYKKRRLVQLDNGHVGWHDELDAAVLAAIKSGRTKILKERTPEEPKIMWYKATCVDILSRREWPGMWIPILRVIGNEIDIEGKLILSGVIRDAKEPQRLLNYGHTAMVEAVALIPKAPYVMAEGQDEGHTDRWEQANTRSFPYLLYKPTTLQGQLVPPPQRQPANMQTGGWEQVNQAAAQGLMRTTGIRFDATMQERLVDESGRALRQLQAKSDTGTLHYYDNLCRTLRQQGRVLIDLIPKVYDTKRIVTILREDDVEEQVTLDPHATAAYSEQKTAAPDGKQTVMKIFNPKIGKYGVTVTIGPSYATKRIEASESMMDFVRAFPQAAQAVMDLVAKNLDWPDADQFATRLAKLVPPELLAPDMKDVPPQVQAIIAGLQKKTQELSQQLQAAMAALNDKNADRSVMQQHFAQQFEQALLKVVADVDTKMAKVAETAVSNYNTHIGAQMKEIAEGVHGLAQALAQPGAGAGGGAAPAAPDTGAPPDAAGDMA